MRYFGAMADDPFEIVEASEGLTLRRKHPTVSTVTLRRVAACLFLLAVLAGALAELLPFAAPAAVVVLLFGGNLVAILLEAEADRGEADAVRRELVIVPSAPFRSSRAAVHLDGTPLGQLVDVVEFDSVTHDRSGLKRRREVTVLVDRGESPPALVSLASFDDMPRAGALTAALRRAAGVPEPARAPVRSEHAPSGPIALMLAMIFGLPLAFIPSFTLSSGAVGVARSVAVVLLDIALVRVGCRWNRRLLARWSEARVAAAKDHAGSFEPRR